MKVVGLETKPKLVMVLVDEPSVVMVTSVEGMFNSQCLFLNTGGHLDVASLTYPLQFMANPDWIANVLEQMRTYNEVEPFVLNRPRGMAADIDLNPCLPREPGADTKLTMNISVTTSAGCVKRKCVNDIVSSRKRACTASYVDYKSGVR
jgi:hypothetical protein